MTEKYKLLYKSNKIAYDVIRCPSDDTIILETHKENNHLIDGRPMRTNTKKAKINYYFEKYINNKK